MTDIDKNFEIYEHHAADLGAFTITPSESNLVGSKAIFVAGSLDASALTIDSSTDSSQLTWTVAADGSSATAAINLNTTSIAALRSGANNWQLTVELSSGVPVIGPKGIIKKYRALPVS